MTKTISNKKYDLCIIGGGASGLMAAAIASQGGLSVAVLEHNGKCGRKLAITGKGRCNVTNDCTLDEFMDNVPTNPRFLYASFAAMPPSEVMSFFESRGVPLKVERGRRVFPVSDSAYDIVDCLVKACRQGGVDIFRADALDVMTDDGAAVGVHTSKGDIMCDNVLLATGGASYPSTGSDGSGYELASRLGHTVVPPKASLVPLVSRDLICQACMGLSLRNVGVGFYKDGKKLYYEQGEMLFTHFGVSGPVILSASAHLTGKFPVMMHIDLKPALDEQQLDARVLRDFEAEKNKDFVNALGGLLPQKLIEPFAKQTGIALHKKVNSITREERKRIVALLKDLPLKVICTRPIEEAIVTSGGISTKEVAPGSMQSKLVKNLYFAGEILDVDAYTGGYNLQIAFSTAALAAKSVMHSKPI